MSPSLLSRLRDSPEALGPFALLIRARPGQVPTLEILCGEILECQRLQDIPLAPPDHVGHWMLCLVPFRQLSERGYECIDDGEPLRLMRVREVQKVGLHEALHQWPAAPVALRNGHFDIDDDAYARMVENIVEHEIHQGEGSNFVVSRTYRADVQNWSLPVALTVFKQLAQQESGGYWTFLVYAGDRTWIGASPEKHVAMAEGIASMNPISGTYRYPPGGATLDGVLAFLGDPKESDELYMVVDEELKMMSAFCTSGARVIGPQLKMMSRLAHTEYLLEGESDADPRTVLRETLLSPAVTGSPIRNACRVIARHEVRGRGYYAGVLALFGRSATGGQVLDSAILIRTADVDGSGELKVSVGASIVRHSDPRAEALESHAKAKALLHAFTEPLAHSLKTTPEVVSLLAQRNAGISRFWLADFATRRQAAEGLTGRELLIVDAEDAFTEMLAQQIRALGLNVVIVGPEERRVQRGDWDLALFGPGPGDPGNLDDVRIRSLRKALRHALMAGKSFMAVCLSHQLLCLELDLPVNRLARPNQGLQAEIDYFGETHKVGFYNTFCAHHGTDILVHRGRQVRVSRNLSTDAVHALRGPTFVSTQFHPESILTERGPALLTDAMLHIVKASRCEAAAVPVAASRH